MPGPNCLIFMTDHQRGDTVLAEGPARMPAIERFREEAVTFSEAFCPSPHCCPSRATFMTGLYPAQHGVWHNVNVANAISRGLAQGVRTWCEDFRYAGYRMWYSGKWHVSDHESPADRGWNTCPSTPSDYSGRKDPRGRIWRMYRELASRAPSGRPSGSGEGEIVTPGWPEYRLYRESEGNQGDVRATMEGVEAIERLAPSRRRSRRYGGAGARERSEAPWCVFVGCTGPHDPYNVPQEFLDLYDLDEIELPPSFADEMADKPGFYRRTRDIFGRLTEREHREGIRHYLAYCSFEDALFGKLLDALERTGQEENTIVMYVSDHGDYMGEHGLWTKGLPCFRGAYHVPLVIRWPGRVKEPGRRVEALVSLADIAPTLLGAAGIEPKREFVGRSLVPFLRGIEPDDWRDCLFTQTNGNELYGIQRAVFSKEFKFVYNGFDYDELYDLRSDPHEMQNVARKSEYAEVVRRLMGRIWRFGYETGDPCVNPYIMVRFASYGPAEAFAGTPARHGADPSNASGRGR